MPSPLDEPEQPTPPSRTPVPDEESTTALAGPLAITNDPVTSPVEAAGEVHTLDVGEGNVVKLDKLGPMIINSDGTLSRIQNWQELHPIEQERTVRLLVKKRNLVRLQQLDAEDASGEEKLGALRDTEAGGKSNP